MDVGRSAAALALMAALGLAAAACESPDAGDLADGGDDGGDDEETLRLYTTVTQDTVDAVTEAFEARSDVAMEVFRAPTGEFNARLAAERREGEVQADVFWVTDPLSMLQYDTDGLLRDWTPENVDNVPEAYRDERFWGTRLLNQVIVARDDLGDPPEAWADLPEPRFEGAVALPDPGFAGSAFGTLAYFALADDFGMAYYRDLAGNDALQLEAIGEVVAAVAEGRADAGMALDKVIRDEADAGAPIELVWPEDGAIAVDSPIGVVETTDQADSAEAFVEFVLTEEAQSAIADTGWQPVHPDVDWPFPQGPTVATDWHEAFERHDELLEEYRAILGE